MSMEAGSKGSQQAPEEARKLIENKPDPNIFHSGPRLPADVSQWIRPVLFGLTE